MISQSYQATFLFFIVTMVTACGSDSSDEPDFNMRGIWSVNLDYGNGLGRSFAIDITTQKSGNFSGSGGAYLVDGMVDGNDFSMSIHTGASFDCGYFTQTYTEEFEIDVATVRNRKISASADWITSCRLLTVGITMNRI